MNKMPSNHRGTSQCAMSTEMLSAATHLYKKFALQNACNMCMSACRRKSRKVMMQFDRSYICKNSEAIQDIITFSVYVTGSDFERFLSFSMTQLFTGNICF